jgi:putative membrane protein
MTDDLIGQFVGQDLLRRFVTPPGRGRASTSALTARVGVAGVEVIRPLPYLGAKPLRVRDLVGTS